MDRSAFATWPGLIEIEEESQGRAILLEIVDSNIERLDDLIKSCTAENADDQAEGQLRAAGARIHHGKATTCGGIQREMPERLIPRTYGLPELKEVERLDQRGSRT